MSIELTVQDGNGEIDVTVSGGGAGRPSVSDSGTLVLSGPADLDFDANLSVFDDGDGTVSIDAASGSGFPTIEDDGVVVVSGADGLNFADNLTVADDGDGSVTIDATSGGTDTRTDVSDSGGTVVSDVEDITFTASADASITVSDDADGTATVDVSATDTDTDTRTDIEDSGAAVLSNVTSINFGNNVTVTDDGDGSVTVDVSGSQPDAEDDGTVIVSGSSAFNFGTDLSVTDDGDGTVTVNSTAGGGSALTVQDDGVDIETDTDTLDLQTDFAVTNPTTGEAEVALDSNQVTVAGNTVSLGGSTGIDYEDLANTGVFPIPNADLANSSVTVAGNSVSLGGSTTIAVGNLSDVDTATLNAGEILIYNATAGQFENADITAGNALTTTTGDASLTLAVASNSIDSDELVSDSVTVAGNTVALGDSTAVSIADLSDVASSTESAGDIPIWNATNTQYENASLIGGDGITVTNGDASISLAVALASSAGLKITSGNLAIEPSDFAGTLLSDDGSDNLQVNESNISHDAIDQTTVSEDDHHIRGGFSRVDINTQSVTASRWESLWVDTSAAGGAVTVTLPADGNTTDGDRVEVGVEDATNNTDVAANTGQSIIGSNPTLTQVGDTVTLEYKAGTSTWMVR
jgi:hypothetical protein